MSGASNNNNSGSARPVVNPGHVPPVSQKSPVDTAFGSAPPSTMAGGGSTAAVAATPSYAGVSKTQGEAFARATPGTTGKSYGRMASQGSSAVARAALVTTDFGAGKDGVMSPYQADAIEAMLLSRIEVVNGSGQAVALEALTDEEVDGFKCSLYAYLALNTGSTSAEDGFGVSNGSETSLYWADYEIPATVIREVFGNGTYRFMRRRANDIHAVISLQYRRAHGKDDHLYPMAAVFVGDMNVVAHKRGLGEYQSLAFVGAEYVSRLSTKMTRLIARAAADTLEGRGHVRDEAREGVADAYKRIRS